MTQWLELSDHKARERELQGVFDSWPSRDSKLLFGAPDWLNAIDAPPVPADKRRRRSFGYDFISDVEFIVGRTRYVVELKYGEKFEPLALAEVLHHAAWTKRYEAETASLVVPVIVSQYNPWLRMAIDEYLRGVVHYVEVAALKDPEGANIWVFDVPRRPGESNRLPSGWPRSTAGQPASNGITSPRPIRGSDSRNR